MGESRRRKLSRDATPEEIFPQGHGPVQPEVGAQMRAILDAVREVIGPRFGVTIFLNERMSDAEIADKGRLPRFNYASTEDRPDMLAVLQAFIAKNSEHVAIDRAFAEEPPTGTKQ